MITNNELDIFNRFVVDQNLQKKVFTIQSGMQVSDNTISFLGAVADPEGFIVLDGVVTRKEDKGLIAWVKRLFTGKQKYEMTVLEFFKSMKNSTSEIKEIEGYAEKYALSIQRAKKNGQIALAEGLERGLSVARTEAQLLATGYTKFLTEETVVKFAKKSPKGIRLDWIKNFARIIPEDILNKKEMLDARYVFDNYVIMHYDPDGKATKMTGAEIAAKKDPILFGVVRNSRKLYYVGDWIDEHCNLTIAQMAEILGGHNDLA